MHILIASVFNLSTTTEVNFSSSPDVNVQNIEVADSAVLQPHSVEIPSSVTIGSPLGAVEVAFATQILNSSFPQSTREADTPQSMSVPPAVSNITSRFFLPETAQFKPGPSACPVARAASRVASLWPTVSSTAQASSSIPRAGSQIMSTTNRVAVYMPTLAANHKPAHKLDKTIQFKTNASHIHIHIHIHLFDLNVFVKKKPKTDDKEELAIKQTL